MDKLKILIAEDDKNYQTLYDHGFDDGSFEKKITEDGDGALGLYKVWKPDIILLDIMMPVKSGYAALKEIRELEKNENEKTVIIMVTSMTDKNDIMDCMKLGIQGYIMKPFKSSEIKNKVMEYYKKARP